MFDLAPMSTTNVITIIQIVVVGVGFIFSWKALKATYQSINTANSNLEVATRNSETAMKSLAMAAQSFVLATSNAQAQLYNQMVVQGRDLQFKFAELFHGGSDPENVKVRQDQFFGTLVGYYSSCFEMKTILPLTTNVQRLLDSDLGELMREDQFRRKWEAIKHLHSREFVIYVENLRGVK